MPDQAAFTGLLLLERTPPAVKTAAGYNNSGPLTVTLRSVTRPFASE
jgi:hypothetical protein